MSEQGKLSYKNEVLPWLRGLFNSRRQTSDIRVSEICQEMLLAHANRLITIYRSPLLRRNECLVKPTKRGRDVLEEDMSSRLQFEPEPGCDDESLDKYFATSTELTPQEVAQLKVKTSSLDDFLDHFSMLDRN